MHLSGQELLGMSGPCRTLRPLLFLFFPEMGLGTAVPDAWARPSLGQLVFTSLKSGEMECSGP